MPLDALFRTWGERTKDELKTCNCCEMLSLEIQRNFKEISLKICLSTLLFRSRNFPGHNEEKPQNVV